jgi:hypothetical protein
MVLQPIPDEGHSADIAPHPLQPRLQTELSLQAVDSRGAVAVSF